MQIKRQIAPSVMEYVVYQSQSYVGSARTTMCPHCQQNAPIAYRGIAAYCTACGRPRTILSASSVTMAGKGSQVGGAVVRTLGYIALAGGTFGALLFGLLFSLISGTAGLVAALSIAILTLIISVPMLRSGKKLAATGDDEKRKQQVQAVFALAANRGGILRPNDVATSLQLTNESADAFLTDLAKTRGDEIDVDVTEQGEVVYKFPRLFFVGASSWAGSALHDRARVASPNVASPNVGAPRPPSQPEIVDAEFEEIETSDKGRRAKA